MIVNSAVSFGLEVIGAAHGNALFRTQLDPPPGTEGTAGALLVDVNVASIQVLSNTATDFLIDVIGSYQ